jgi:ABC-type antimicrobial peptide transport system permease subunit
VIINAEMARRMWGDESALGHRLRFGDAAFGERWFTVVGIVDLPSGSSIGNRSLQPAAYVPLVAAPGRNLAIVVGADRDPAPLAAEVRSAVAALDRDQPVENLMTMEQALARWAAPGRFIAMLMALLGAVALLLAAMGTFGVVAFAVSQRTREIGVRLALGATPQQVQRLMAGAGVRLAAAGLAFGLPAAWASTRLLRGVLSGTSPTDPTVFGAVSTVLGVVTLLAAWIPARRAARVDPLLVLRSE